MTTHKPIVRLTAGSIAAACFAATLPPADAGDFAAPLEPAPAPVEDDWQFGFEIYAWTPAIQGTTSTGFDLDIGFDDILDNLNMTAMFALGASKGRWFFGTDVIYLDMGNDIYTRIGPRKDNAKVSVDMETWIVNPVAGYSVLEGDWGRFDVFGGARYIHIKVDTGVSVNLPRLGSVYSRSTSSGGSWAGIAGVRGAINLSERWYLPYYADIGTGDPDLTWQVFAGIGYRFSNFDLIVGYRYLDWDLDPGAPLSGLDINGPIFGVKFTF